MIKRIEPINKANNTLKNNTNIINKNKKKKKILENILDEYIKNEN